MATNHVSTALLAIYSPTQTLSLVAATTLLDVEEQVPLHSGTIDRQLSYWLPLIASWTGCHYRPRQQGATIKS